MTSRPLPPDPEPTPVPGEWEGGYRRAQVVSPSLRRLPIQSAAEETASQGVERRHASIPVPVERRASPQTKRLGQPGA